MMAGGLIGKIESAGELPRQEIPVNYYSKRL
jgi:hypothetical protein